tara:strand:+ start:459 stop:1100 length:642 start_codon:yes stop_codon:yes gene_type:complete
MDTSIKDFLFLPLDIPNPPDITDELDKISHEEMTKDLYRNCHHIPIMRWREGKGTWIFDIPPLTKYLIEHVFPWSRESRVVIITTEPFEKNPPHIDCSPEMFNTIQHKFRFVFQGKTDDLAFLTQDGNLHAPNINKPFIMDGSWPHEMKNTTDKRKYTLALGHPWEPRETDLKYSNLLHKSYKKYKNDTLLSQNRKIVDNYESLYEDVYKSKT